MRRLPLVGATICLLIPACSGKSKPAEKPASQPVSLFVTSDLQGTIEPCGCSTDPLGDLARTAHIIEGAKKDGRSIVHVDGGSTLYSMPALPDDMIPQEELKASLIKDTFQRWNTLVGLGPYDFALGPEKVGASRHAVNVKGKGIESARPTIRDTKGLKIGVFGVVSPEALSVEGVEVTDPVAAAKNALEALKGADAVVLLAHMPKPEAVRLVQTVPGIDFAVVGQTVPQTKVVVKEEPERVGQTWLLEPVDRGQVLTQLDLHFTKKGPWTDAIGEARAKKRMAALDEDIAALKADLAKWRKEAGAEEAFLAGKERELASYEAEKKKLAKHPLQIPKEGSWFVYSQIKIKKGLPCDAQVQQAKHAYDKAVGEANLKAAKGKKPSPPAEGTAGYVGMEECEGCHDEAVEFWKKTRHAQAWKTLTDVDKAFNYECIGCHVTGWDEPGGSTMGHNDDLRNVQCENCHGPGSIHADSAEKKDIVLSPPDTRCKNCHNEKHSDTFQFEAYLRDVTGKGHAETFRKKLGDGPTGYELRKAGLEKAGKIIGAGCAK